MTPSKTRDELIEDGLQIAEELAAQIARRQPGRVDRSAILSAALLALVTAADGYDSTRGGWLSRVKTYVRWRVSDAIGQELAATRLERRRMVDVEAHRDERPLPPDYFKGLSNRERHLLRMRYEDGRTFSEIAVHLGMSKGGAHVMHKRVLARLRERMDGGSL